MSMNTLINDVKERIEEEYKRASFKFGATNNSDHESYAVLLEEMEEAESEVVEARVHLEAFWLLTKANDDDLSKFSLLMELERRATLAACELIQVAAMAKKASITVRQRSEVVGENT